MDLVTCTTFRDLGILLLIHLVICRFVRLVATQLDTCPDLRSWSINGCQTIYHTAGLAMPDM